MSSTRWPLGLATAVLLSATASAFDEWPFTASPEQSATATHAQTARVPLGRDWMVAQRVDERRIVVLSDGGELYLPQRELESSAPILQTRTVTPGRLFELPASRVQDVLGTAARVGDRWTIDTGRGGEFQAIVERFVLGYKNCGEAWGVVAAVDEPRFRDVSDKYFMARQASPEARPVTRSTVGPVPYQLTDARRARITDLLEREFRRTWPSVRDEAAQWYGRADDARRGQWSAGWRRLDADVDRGQGRLAFDVQAFRLTPDGDPRLFVRARWVIGSRVVYAMSVWMRDGRTFSIDQSDVLAARRLRMSEFHGDPFGNDRIGLVLNAFDLDGDGQAEVLMSVTGYESRNLELFVYPPPAGGRGLAIATYADGC